MKNSNKTDRVRLADRLRVGCSVAILLFAMLCKANPGPVPVVLAFLVFFAFLSVEFLMNRCPHCGAYLGRNWGKFCQHCGQCIRPDKPDT